MTAMPRVGQSAAMTDATGPDAEWSDLAERTEALAMQRMMHQQPVATVERLGISAPALADGVHCVVVRDPMWGYWNKALGFCTTVSEDTVLEATTRAGELQVPAFAFQIQPRALPDDWAAVCERHQLAEGTMFVKFFGPLRPRPVETDLRIARLTAEDAPAFTRVMSVGFGFEETPESHALFDAPQYFEGDWAAYGAYDGDTLVATARMCVVRETDAVALFGAATVPAGRNRGAQAALMDARIREARDRGARYASAETWLETPGNPNPSQHNMRRAGLTEVHTRPSWVWRHPDPD
jgi:GNAT superfamily N-acetyltransferase